MNIILYTDWVNIERYKKGEEWTAVIESSPAFQIQVLVNPEHILQKFNNLCFIAGKEI